MSLIFLNKYTTTTWPYQPHSHYAQHIIFYYSHLLQTTSEQVLPPFWPVVSAFQSHARIRLSLTAGNRAQMRQCKCRHVQRVPWRSEGEDDRQIQRWTHTHASFCTSRVCLTRSNRGEWWHVDITPTLSAGKLLCIKFNLICIEFGNIFEMFDWSCICDVYLLYIFIQW